MQTVTFVLLLIVATALSAKSSSRGGLIEGPPTVRCNEYAGFLTPTRLLLLSLAMILLGLKQSPLTRLGQTTPGE